MFRRSEEGTFVNSPITIVEPLIDYTYPQDNTPFLSAPLRHLPSASEILQELAMYTHLPTDQPTDRRKDQAKKVSRHRFCCFW